MNSLKTILMSSVAAITFAAAPALAQQTMTPTAPTDAQPEVQATPDAMRSYDDTYGERFVEWGDKNVETLLGLTVVNDAGETIGDVDNFALVEDQIVAVIGVGGFLGLGEHQVGVALDQLQLVDDQVLLAGVTREQLQAMPAYDEAGGTAFTGDQTLRSGFESVTPGALGTAETAATDPSPLAPPVTGDTPAESVAVAADNAGKAIEDAADGATDEIAEAGRDAGAAIDNAADQAAEEVADVADGAVTPLAPETAADTPAVTAPVGTAPVATEMAADDAGGWTEEMDTIFADIADRQIAELIGMPVASAEGEVVGEVDNFVLDGQKIAAIVGVGGFLGMGEHEVALSLGDMTFDGEKLVLSSLTEDQLRDMPEFDDAEPNFLPQDGTLRTPYEN